MQHAGADGEHPFPPSPAREARGCFVEVRDMTAAYNPAPLHAAPNLNPDHVTPGEQLLTPMCSTPIAIPNGVCSLNYIRAFCVFGP